MVIPVKTEAFIGTCPVQDRHLSPEELPEIPALYPGGDKLEDQYLISAIIMKTQYPGNSWASGNRQSLQTRGFSGKESGMTAPVPFYEELFTSGKSILLCIIYTAPSETAAGAHPGIVSEELPYPG